MIAKTINKFKKLNFNIYIIAVTLFVNCIMYFSWYPILPIYLRDLGASDLIIGYIYGVLTFGFTLFQFLGGIFADRFDLKKILVVTTFLSAPAFVLVGLSPNWLLLVVFMLIIEVLTAVQWPAFMLFISECSDEKELGFAYSVFEFSILASFTVGPAVGSIVLSRFSVPLLMLMSGIVCLITAVIRQIYLKTPERKVHGSYDFKILKQFINRRYALILILFVLLGLIGTITIYGPFIAMYSKDIFKFSESKIQLLIFLGNLFASMFSFIAGYLVDKYGTKIMFGLGLFLQGVFFLFWIKATGYGGVFFYFFAAMMFLQGAAVAKNKLIMESAPEKYRGLFVGLIYTLSGIFASTGPVIASYARNLYGNRAPFYLNFLLGCIIVIFVIVYSMQKDKSK
ncbi:MAG: MFS transporter [Armatimonadota bacterium]